MSHFTNLFCLLTLAISASAGLIARDATSAPGLQRRADYTQVFAGTGDGPDDRDAAIQGDGYLTFTVTDTPADCFAFCDGIPTCVFVNYFYEFNDPAPAPQPVFKCSAYSVVHDESYKTNYGGQVLGEGLDPTYIQNSFGYSNN
ncbi:hypothetical protein BDN72DRAFT_903876 [Pluteus cervinus]|uniref:Uncharacterized protein n=1 Tax=Pluteus cervinus TaxID=181527 RepID=A0ACD3A7L3_9AGAR|nr:hypothetical protein BDN72DRAFT_903876 [Pluteus cervinus]